MDRERFFEELYMETYKGLFRYIKGVSGREDMIEDILQETFFEAYKQLDKLSGHENPKGWLYKTASFKLKAMNRLRDNMNYTVDEFIDLVDRRDEFSECELMVALDSMLGTKEKMLFCQYYLEGFTGSEISDKLGITEANFKVKMHRAKKKIQFNLL